MKVPLMLLLIFSLSFPLLFLKKTGLRVNVSEPVNRQLSVGADSLIGSCNKLFLSKSVCTFPHEPDTFYSTSTLMPANEYGIYSTYTGNVTVVTMYGNRYLDSIRFLWDYEPAAFGYYGACVPNPNLFPYDHIEATRDDVFLIKLVPLSALKEYTGKPYWQDMAALGTVKLAEIKCIDKYYLEKASGIINQKFPGEYADPRSALGIICMVRMKSNRVIPCFLITTDMQPSPSYHVLWKE